MSHHQIFLNYGSVSWLVDIYVSWGSRSQRWPAGNKNPLLTSEFLSFKFEVTKTRLRTRQAAN